MNGNEGLYATSFTNKGPAIQIPVPKDRTVTGKFYKNIVLRKLKNYYKIRRPKTGLKYLHDNASAHKAYIMTDILESEKVTALPHPPYSPDLQCFCESAFLAFLMQ